MQQDNDIPEWMSKEFEQAVQKVEPDHEVGVLTDANATVSFVPVKNVLRLPDKFSSEEKTG